MKWIRRFGYGVAALVVLLLLLAWSGNAVHWNRQAPYERVRAWGEAGNGPGAFHDPTGIAVSGDRIFVADARNSRIQVLNQDGDFLRAFGSERLGRPMNLAIADNRVYVPDYFQDVVQVFTLDGDHQRVIEAEDGFDSPGGVAVRADDSLLVADTYAQRVVHLDPDGTVLRSWQGTGIGPGEFSYPTDVAVAPDGGFYVADGYNDRIQQFGPDGTLVRKWGGPFAMNISGPFKGWFATVTSVAVGPAGNVYVADFYNDRIQKFTAAGRFLTAFGSAAEGPGHSAMAVAVDAEDRVWSTHLAGNRVEQWRPADRR